MALGISNQVVPEFVELCHFKILPVLPVKFKVPAPVLPQNEPPPKIVPPTEGR